MSWPDLKRKLIVSFIFGLVVLAVLAFLADLPQTLAALDSFQWGYLPLVLGLSLFNYSLRFIKWQWYLRLIGVDIPWGRSQSIFASSMSMVMTPAKLGEFVKSYMLRVTDGVPMARSAPIILAERMTDGMAMIFLSVAGLSFYQAAWPLLAVLLAGMVGGVLVVQSRALSLRLITLGERLPVLSRFSHSLHDLYTSSYQLFRWRNLLLAILIGIVSWSGECVAMYLVLIGLGVPGSLTLLLQITFIFCFSTLIGAVSALPGGLGASEASLGGLLVLLVGLPKDLSVLATLLIRLCTLWFGVTLGLVALFVFRKRFFGGAELMPLNGALKAQP
ncbi:MAG: flippase-like domain-containing protein [Chloroflexi bacterium]|nr:flippase-like domain-containing protein [Chloroflexota bacterium]MBI3733747.1 flippase-like domain-containing protein [Chloroflexota bacterium]